MTMLLLVLATMTNGKKLHPFVVFKGVKSVAELQKVPGMVAIFSQNG